MAKSSKKTVKANKSGIPSGDPGDRGDFLSNNVVQVDVIGRDAVDVGTWLSGVRAMYRICCTFGGVHVQYGESIPTIHLEGGYYVDIVKSPNKPLRIQGQQSKSVVQIVFLQAI